MNFTPEIIAWIAFISIGWLVLGIGFGMLFGKAMKLNGVRRFRQDEARSRVVVLELDSTSRHSTKTGQEPYVKDNREFGRQKKQT